MFTGIIEEVGHIIGFEARETGTRLTIGSSAILNDVTPGASIAVNGACLTAVEVSSDRWMADLAPETLERTNFSDLQAGSAVNLERPLRANSRWTGILCWATWMGWQR